MMNWQRDVAKVLAGFSANEALGHWWLGIWGDTLLPMHVGWFTFTRVHNWAVMVVWPVVLLMCVYFGWRSGVASRDGASESTTRSTRHT